MTATPPQYATPVDVLSQISQRRTRQGERLYLLADGTRLTGLPMNKRSNLDVQQGTSLLGVSAGHDAHAAGPLLFAMELADWDTSRRVQQLASILYAQACSVIVSEQPLVALAEALRKHLDVILPDGEDMLMRFFDPRVLPFWFDILPAESRCVLASTLQSWGYVDHRQQMAWLTLEESSTAEVSLPFTIDQAQQDKLMCQCLPYVLLDRLSVDPGSLLTHVPGDKRYEHISALIDKAQSHGFDGMADMEEFCRLGLRYGLDFDVQSPMKRVFSQRRPEQHVHELLAQLGSADLDDMAVSMTPVSISPAKPV
jgi:hypothetical protein